MKLIGSKVEEQIRNQLIITNKNLFNSEEGRRIIQILESVVGKLKSAYMLNWTPSQAEDYYRFLVNGKVVVRFELPRPYQESEACGIEVEDVRTYRRHLKGRLDNLQLLIALELSEKDMVGIERGGDDLILSFYI